ncbi:MAG: tRNA glutamyl-Q(34) synthetase GluQRS [Thiogranum sp.]|nr:tRNA glutamyl-Q(34) synthetase GluQRS [Thiogranum sp.]
MPDALYRGRFAPSPNGPLHFGSLLTAVGSYLDARSHHGEWLVRIENLDPPREVAGSAQNILQTLESFGLYWDGPILYQGQRHDAYGEALEELGKLQLLYPCACSRRDLQLHTLGTTTGRIYPGTCRAGIPKGRGQCSTRVRVGNASVQFVDRSLGLIEENLASEVGDFVLQRADGLFAYQLAVVIDDAEQKITDVVRGMDLLASTCRQIYLQQVLNLPTPRYLHLPIVVNQAGEKLSKQTHAPAIDPADPVPPLIAALRCLGQTVPDELEHAQLDEFWAWAVNAWNPAHIPSTGDVTVPN